MRPSLLIGVLVTVPVLVVVALAGVEALAQRSTRALPCRVLPNLVVPALTSWSRGCPLEPYERILAFRRSGTTHWLESARALSHEAASGVSSLALHVRGSEGARWVVVPVVEDVRGRATARFAASLVLSAALLATSWAILVGSAARAALPLHGFYCAVCVFLVGVLCGRDSWWLGIAGALAWGAIPATLAHLALTFPAERVVVQRVPRLVPTLYLVAGVLTLLNVVNRDRSPGVWEMTDRILLVLSVTAWALLVLGCALARNESGSLLERSRARALLWGSALVPLLPLALAATLAPELPGGASSLIAVGAALLPLPVGYAIVRHRLFDLEIDLRRGVARLLGATGTTLAICVAVLGASSALGSTPPLGDPAVLFAASLLGVLAGEPLRSRLRGSVRRWVAPETAALESRSEELAQRMGECVDPAKCARLLCDSVAEGLDRGASLFLMEESSWHLAHARGASALIDWSASARAARVTRATGLVHLAQEEVHREPSACSLREDGIEYVARLRSASEDVALLLVAGSRRGLALDTPELAFLAAVVRQAALGIHNAQLARSVVAAERAAARGRAGAALVHDLGKPLGVIERLATRLPGQPGMPARACDDAETIASLAKEMRATLGSADPRLRGPDDCTETALDEMIDRAVQLVARSHGPGRVAVRIAPGLSQVIGPVEPMIRVLVNLLDNALLATRGCDVVEIAARGDARRLEIDVIDRGCGMSRAEMHRACEPFFTTRRASGGSGLGLTICRDLLESMGGKLVLSSSPGLGTRARVELSIGSRP